MREGSHGQTSLLRKAQHACAAGRSRSAECEQPGRNESRADRSRGESVGTGKHATGSGAEEVPARNFAASIRTPGTTECVGVTDETDSGSRLLSKIARRL